VAADWVLQDAVFDRLAGFSDLTDLLANGADSVYDFVPQELTETASGFPFVVTEGIQSQEWDTDTELGSDSTVMVHTWSRYRGKREAGLVMAQVYAALHRHALAVSGYEVVLCQWDGLATLMVEPDGLTYHGVQRFRVLLRTGA